MVESHVTDPFRYQLNPCFLLHFYHHLLSNNSALTPRIITWDRCVGICNSLLCNWLWLPVSTLGNCFRQAVRTMDFYLLVVSGVSTLSFWGGEAERIQSGVGGCRHAEFSPAWTAATQPTPSEDNGLWKPSDDCLLDSYSRPKLGLFFQRMWYRLDRRQDTSGLEHSLRSRDTP